MPIYCMSVTKLRRPTRVSSRSDTRRTMVAPMKERSKMQFVDAAHVRQVCFSGGW